MFVAHHLISKTWLLSGERFSVVLDTNFLKIFIQMIALTLPSHRGHLILSTIIILVVFAMFVSMIIKLK